MSPPDSTKQDDKKVSQRRINKPLIEKRRRARINDCLSQLKSIVLEAQETQGPRPSKLEKADILEMTVEFIKKRTASEKNASKKRLATRAERRLAVRKSRNGIFIFVLRTGTSLPLNDFTEFNGCHDDKNHQNNYVAGFTGCLNEVSKFLIDSNGINRDLRETILKHMADKIRDSNNNIGPVLESAIKTTDKLPIPRDPNKSVIENNNDGIPLKTAEKNVIEESNKCVSGQDMIGNTVPSEFHNLQNYAAELFSGSQVLLVLQLPSTQNMLGTNPTLLPMSGVAKNPHSAFPVFQGSSLNSVVDLSKPQSRSNKSVLNPHHPKQQTVDDPSAILASFDPCNKPTEIAQSVQSLPLNLCTGNQHAVRTSVSDPWRPW